jgi:hypothetical protein
MYTEHFRDHILSPSQLVHLHVNRNPVILATGTFCTSLLIKVHRPMINEQVGAIVTLIPKQSSPKSTCVTSNYKWSPHISDNRSWLRGDGPAHFKVHCILRTDHIGLLFSPTLPVPHVQFKQNLETSVTGTLLTRHYQSATNRFTPSTFRS